MKEYIRNALCSTRGHSRVFVAVEVVFKRVNNVKYNPTKIFYTTDINIWYEYTWKTKGEIVVAVD